MKRSAKQCNSKNVFLQTALRLQKFLNSLLLALSNLKLFSESFDRCRNLIKKDYKYNFEINLQ